MLVSLFVLHLLTYFTEAGPVALLELLQVKPMSRSSRWHRPNLPSVFTPTTPSDPGSLFCTLSLPLSLVIKQTLKKRILQVNLHLWSRYKKQRFFFFSFVFTRRIKLHDEMSPRLLLSSSRIVRVRSVYPLSSEWQAPPENRVQQRGSTCFWGPGSPGGGWRVVLPSSDSWAVALTVPAGTCLGGETCILRALLGFRLAPLLPLLSRIAVLWLAVAEH